MFESMEFPIWIRIQDNKEDGVPNLMCQNMYPDMENMNKKIFYFRHKILKNMFTRTEAF